MFLFFRIFPGFQESRRLDYKSGTFLGLLPDILLASSIVHTVFTDPP
jgi:hypothetical protein